MKKNNKTRTIVEKSLRAIGLISGLVSALIGTGCAKTYQALSPTATQAANGVGCQTLETRLYDVVYAALKDQNRMVTADELKGTFASVLSAQFPQWTLGQRDAALNLIEDFYSRLPLGQKDSQETPHDILKRVLQAEMGVRSSSAMLETQAQLSSWRARYAKEQVNFENPACQGTGPSSPGLPPSPVTPPSNPVPTTPQGATVAAVDPLVYSARKVLMTAYQNCEAGAAAPMDASVPNVNGITVIGKNGAGLLRTISSVSEVLSTDYYLRDFNLPNNSCFDVSKNPLIYNYGGKPYATSTAGSALNIFIEAGGGGKTLGIDCSGYVVAVVATSGLRFSPNTDVKPLLVEAVSSTMFTDPSNNGMSCFSKVSMGKIGTIVAGDIVATHGHVFLIDSVGADPFAINAASSDAECDSISSDNFDFIIAQSDPSKDGIGINRIQASYYLTYTGEFKTGFETYARAACHAKFARTNVTTTNAGIQVIRHNHSAQCLSKQPVPLDGVQCISSCAALTDIKPQF